MTRTNFNGVDRNMTAAEEAAYELAVAQMAADEERNKAEADARLEARKAPLRKLGLSDDEIAAVLG